MAPSEGTRESAARDVMQRMTRERACHLPVLDGGRLAGIGSIGDVVKGLLEDLELEVRVLRDYARVRGGSRSA